MLGQASGCRLLFDRNSGVNSSSKSNGAGRMQGVELGLGLQEGTSGESGPVPVLLRQACS